jgi:hypothetical protein
MKNDLSHTIPGFCVSKAEMISYLQKSVDTKSLIKIGNHLQSCEYCSEALRGLQQLPDLSSLNALSIAWKAKNRH